MRYDFDKTIAREGTSSIKLDALKSIYGRADVIPMWVADMDFETPPAIIEAIKQRAEHPILGYTYRGDSFFNSIISWVGRRGGWKIEKDWIDFTPGVVPGISFAIKALSAEGDGVVIQPPVYHPFAGQIQLNNRRVVDNPLRWSDGRYEIDFEDLEKKLADARIFLLCNPHNPSGRVFTREELARMGELCIEHNVVILADEIHSDLVYKPHRHTHIASISEDIASATVTFLAPSKTFNVAGLSTSVSVVSNDSLRRRLRAEYDTLHATQGNIFGAVALQAAYDSCEDWLEQLLGYLKGNIDYVCGFVAENLPGVEVAHTEGTYLMWLNFKSWAMDHNDVYGLIVERAGIGVNQGQMFGHNEGDCWMRFNIATSRSTVERAMKQLAQARDLFEAR